MNWWVSYASVVVGLPVLLVVRWLVVDWMRNKRGHQDSSVSAIRERVEHERADCPDRPCSTGGF